MERSARDGGPVVLRPDTLSLLVVGVVLVCSVQYRCDLLYVRLWQWNGVHETVGQ